MIRVCAVSHLIIIPLLLMPTESLFFPENFLPEIIRNSVHVPGVSYRKLYAIDDDSKKGVTKYISRAVTKC